jgi:hypothetical protein
MPKYKHSSGAAKKNPKLIFFLEKIMKIIIIHKYWKFLTKIWKKVFYTEFLALIIEYSVQNLKKAIITENWNLVKNAVIFTPKSVKNWIFFQLW